MSVRQGASWRWTGIEPSEEMGGYETNLRVPHDVEQRNNIRSAREVLENLDFSLDLLLLHRLQNLDNAFLIVDHVDAFENLRVLSAPW